MFKRKLILFSIFFTVFVSFMLLSYSKNKSIKEEKQTNEYYSIEGSLTEESLLDAILYNNIQYPDIVYAQAILETGHFQSKICTEYNNLFGLYDSRKKDYYKFDHWSDSVKGYKDYVQKKYRPPECYYSFLEKLPYATDTLYIKKIKQLVKQYENISIR